MQKERLLALKIAAQNRKSLAIFSRPGSPETVMRHCVVLSPKFKNLLMPLLFMGCFPGDFQEGKRPIIRHLRKRPIKVGKRPIKEGKRPINANGLFSSTPQWRKTAPLKRSTKRSMRHDHIPRVLGSAIAMAIANRRSRNFTALSIAHLVPK